MVASVRRIGVPRRYRAASTGVVTAELTLTLYLTLCAGLAFARGAITPALICVWLTAGIGAVAIATLRATR